MYNVIKEVVDNETNKVNSFTTKHIYFDCAKRHFHQLEKDLVNAGYDLDDDTKDYTEDYVDNCEFFNNATNETTTVRLFLERH